ncbi:GFA family protein [Methylomonas sp. AM2-LC]|uniref:GFA family protein n=1 Tax=Methylomonas sp. AM2-LC TaxID=3153301 RepID=UPI003266E11D
MYKGSCLCGSVKYEIKGELGAAVYCHCVRCRKASGSAFAANATVAEDSFKIVQGAESLKMFSTAEGVHRIFCSACGSPIISKRDSFPGVFRLRLGTLDTPITERLEAHIFVSSKADWYEIHDSLPQYTERVDN